MRRIAVVVALLLSVTPSFARDKPLHTINVLRDGLRLDQRQCDAIPTALWLPLDGDPACMRYWIAGPAAPPGEDALVLLHGDIGRRVRGRYVLGDDDRFTASEVQYEARAVARIFPGYAIVLGRPGTYGSSGSHLADRRTVGEVHAIAAALDALKTRHGIKRLHFAGHSGGGHIVAALAQTRNDIGCAVITSGALSVVTMQRDAGRPLDRRPLPFYDPIDHVASMAAHPGLRLIVVSDPDDRIVSFRSQREFVDRVRARDLPIMHITAAAPDKQSHNLHAHGIRLAADCAKGMDDRALTAKYQTKPPRREAVPAHSAAAE
jgi:pimeloyl-ACP methyl ester carboxylesterase